MTKSSYVFEKGNAIDIGNHGEHGYVYESGEPVPDTGVSTFVFESGTGIGGILWKTDDDTANATFSFGPGHTLKISHDGATEDGVTASGDDDLFPSAWRDNTIPDPTSWDILFKDIDFTANSIHNNLDVGATSSTSPRLFANSTYFASFSWSEAPGSESNPDYDIRLKIGDDSGRTNHETNTQVDWSVKHDIRLTYDGSTVRLYIDGNQIISGSADFSGATLRGGVSIEDDGSSTSGETVVIGNYIEN